MEEIHIHIHHDADPRLESIEKKIDAILYKTEQIIMANTELLALVSEVNDATNVAAARLAALMDQISTGMTAAEVAEVKAALTIEVADLKALGADPAVPVPEPTSIPEPPVV